MAKKNTSSYTLPDGRMIFLSYGTPVAAFVPGFGYVRTAQKYSVTSSKHANQFAGKDSPVLPDAEFRDLIDGSKVYSLEALMAKKAATRA